MKNIYSVWVELVSVLMKPIALVKQTQTSFMRIKAYSGGKYDILSHNSEILSWDFVCNICDLWKWSIRECCLLSMYPIICFQRQTGWALFEVNHAHKGVYLCHLYLLCINYHSLNIVPVTFLYLGIHIAFTQTNSHLIISVTVHSVSVTYHICCYPFQS